MDAMTDIESSPDTQNCEEFLKQWMIERVETERGYAMARGDVDVAETFGLVRDIIENEWPNGG
jgi:hypothetical protein